MKKGIHPESYRPVVFKDMSNGDMFLLFYFVDFACICNPFQIKKNTMTIKNSQIKINFK